MPALDFGQFVSVGRDSQISDYRLVNGFIETTEAGEGPLRVALDRPGLTRWDQASYTLPNRGLLSVRGKGVYAVTGPQLVRFIDNASLEEIGVIGGSSDIGLAADYGLVTMASNMRSGVEVGIVTEDGQYYYLDTSTNTLTLYAGGNLPGVKSIDFVDRYFVFALSDGRFAHTDLDDAGNINALAFAYAESRPDGLRRIIEHRGSAIALGESSMEVFENAGTIPFAFAPIRSDIEIGTMSTWGPCRVKDTLLWPDHHGEVQMMVGSEPERVSNHGIEIAISNLSDAERQGLRGASGFAEGHHFYILTSNDWTYAFDIVERKWYEWNSADEPNFLAQNSIEHEGRIIFGSSADGKLYSWDSDAHADDGQSFTFAAHSATVRNFPNGGVTNRLALNMVRGVGNLAGSGDAPDPKVMLDWSVDGGKTYRGGRIAELGAVGQYRKRAHFRSLGRFGDVGIIYRVSSSSPVRRAIMGADVNIAPLAS